MPFQKGHKFGYHGKQPNAGRKPLKVRELCAKMFVDRLPLLAAIADDAKEQTKERIAAMALLAKYGVGDKVDLDLGGNVTFTVNIGRIEDDDGAA